MKKIMFYLQVVLLLLVVAGCGGHAQFGVKIDQNKVTEIKKGVTTKAEVEALLGVPTTVSMIGDGRRMMSYTYTELSSQVKAATYIPFVGAFAGGGTSKTRTQTLQVMISKSGVVEDYEFSDNTQAQNMDARGGMKSTSTPTTESKGPGAH